MNGSSVLFVEDDLICNLETCEYLRESGLRVLQVYCAAAALEVIDRRRPLWALVTDIDLGPGPDGFAVARSARAAYPDLTVIYISGAAAARVPAESVADAVFIAKPFHPQDVVEALGRAGNRAAA
jgi:DNA-binding NtrC family response regulator